MRYRIWKTRATRIAAAAVLIGSLAAAAAATASAQPAKRARPPENIKLLTGWDGDQVRAEMRLITEAIGVKCEHCHVQGNFASDEKRAKHTARRMIELTMSLNGDYFAGYDPEAGASKFGRVTCYTCHQGAATPKQSAGAEALAW